MASLALRARTPIVTIIALFGLTLAFRPETHHHRGSHHACPSLAAADHPVSDVLVPPAAFADAQAWPRGMVMGMPETNDPIAHNALTDLLSGLFDVVRSLRV